AGAHRSGGGAVLVELIGQRHGEARRVCGSKQLLRVGGPGGGLGPGFPVDVEGGQTRRAQLGLTGTGTEIPAPGAGGGGGHWRRHAILRMVVGSVSTSILHVEAPTCTTAGARHPPSSPTPRRRIPFSPSYPTAFVPPPSCPTAVVPHRPYGERNVRDIMNRFTRPLSCVRQWGRWRKVAFGDGGAGQEVRRRSPPSVGRWLTRWRGAHPVAGCSAGGGGKMLQQERQRLLGLLWADAVTQPGEGAFGRCRVCAEELPGALHRPRVDQRIGLPAPPIHRRPDLCQGLVPGDQTGDRETGEHRTA